MKKYPIEDMKESPFYFPREPEPVLRQLIFMLDHLLSKGYTLSVICPSDFVFRDKVLFLKKDHHIVKLSDGHFTHTSHVSHAKCFAPAMLQEGKNGLDMTYASVGLFAYYLWTRKKKSELTETDYGKLKGTKVHYFIRNTLEKDPILFYL